MHSKIFVPNKFQVSEIKSILEKKYSAVKEESSTKNTTLSFVSKKGEVRKLTIIANSKVSGFEGTVIRVPGTDDSMEICKTITKVTGGFFKPHADLSTWMSEEG